MELVCEMSMVVSACAAGLQNRPVKGGGMICAAVAGDGHSPTLAFSAGVAASGEGSEAWAAKGDTTS